MRLFELHRVEDESGVSGTGVVAQGVEFDNHWCALTWLTTHTSVAFYPSIAEVEAIHGHSGKTILRFLLEPGAAKICLTPAKASDNWICTQCGATNATCRLGCWHCPGTRPA